MLRRPLKSGCEGDGVIGDPMEGALLALAAKCGIQRESVSPQRRRITEIPFDAAHKFMATFHRTGENVEVFVKGAPDVLLPRCERLHLIEGEKNLNSASEAEIENAYHEFANQGLRGLLIARRTIPNPSSQPNKICTR